MITTLSPKDLSLDTKIIGESPQGYDRLITDVGFVLSELKEHFPDGFYSRDATIFLRSTLNDVVPKFERGGAGKWVEWANFYKILAQAGYLESKEEELKGGRSKYHYAVKPEVLAGYKKSEPEYTKPEEVTAKEPLPSNFDTIEKNFYLPDKLDNLVQAFVLLRGYSNEDKFVQSALEQKILSDEKFLKVMRIIRQESPQVYTTMGGGYLDILLQEKKADVVEQPKPTDYSNKPVYELELSIRSLNCLKNANILTLGELQQKTEAELLKIKYFGRKPLAEIKEVLASMGLSLKAQGTSK